VQTHLTLPTHAGVLVGEDPALSLDLELRPSLVVVFGAHSWAGDGRLQRELLELRGVRSGIMDWGAVEFTWGSGMVLGHAL